MLYAISGKISFNPANNEATVTLYNILGPFLMKQSLKTAHLITFTISK